MKTAENALKLPALYRCMLRIRRVEEALAERYGAQEMRCPMHLCIGEEAIAAGVCASLNGDDAVFGNHRSHGHYLAQGGDLNAMVAELYGKATGCCGGRGGSMHLIDLKAGFLGAVPIVGATVPLAVGTGWAFQRKRNNAVSVVFFGDGCFEEGVMHEAMNFAALKGIPVIFVCENNGMSCFTALKERQPDRPMHGIAEAHGLTVSYGDGNDVWEVAQVASQAIARAREGGGPHFLEFRTSRWMGHVGPHPDDALGYRPHEPPELRESLCPIKRTRADLRARLGWGEPAFDTVEHTIRDEVEEAFRLALQAPPPDPETAPHHVYATSRVPFRGVPASPSSSPSIPSRTLTFGGAIQEALRQAMENDPSVMVIGEGVPDPKAIFETTAGLQAAFGPDRVCDMPLAENGMTGVCIGLALQGVRPVLVHQRIDFTLLAADQLINNAAKWHYLFDGQVSVPFVIRVLIGRGWGQGPQHAQSLHAMFAHIPGLKVVLPTTPHDAKGMLMQAIEDNNPVLFVEHRWLHHLTGEVPEAPFRVPLDKARLLHSGRHVTVAAFSLMSIEALRVAEVMRRFGVTLDVIDMRSARPLDVAPVVASLQVTGRLMVLDTGWAACGVSAELIARVAEEAFAWLKKPPVRITLPDYPTPTSWYLTDDYYPDGEHIIRGVLSLLDSALSAETMCRQVRRTARRDVPNPAFKGPF